MKVKVLPQTHAGEEVLQQAIDAAASQMGAGKTPPSADVIRDAAGKLVSVNVTLPDNATAGELAAAAAKINENPGVSKAGAFPSLTDDDMEAGVNGVAVVTLGGGLISVNGAEFNSASPIAGSIDCKNVAGIWIQRHTALASSLGVSRLLSFTMECKVKNISQLIISDAEAQLRCGVNTANGNFWYTAPTTNVSTDSGIAYADDTVYTIHIKVTQDLIVYYIDGVLVALVPTSPFFNGSRAAVQVRAASLAKLAQLDDLAISVLDAIV